jgi:hypothetical protein
MEKTDGTDQIMPKEDSYEKSDPVHFSNQRPLLRPGRPLPGLHGFIAYCI